MKRTNHKQKFVLTYVLSQVINHLKMDYDGKFYDTGDILIMLEPDEYRLLKDYCKKIGIDVK